MSTSRPVPSKYHLPGKSSDLNHVRPNSSFHRSGSSPPQTPPALARPPREPWARHKLAAWMASTRGAVPTPSADPTSHFLNLGKSANLSLHQVHWRNHPNQLERQKKMTLANPAQGENLEGLHRDISTICSTICSEMRSGEARSAVEPCPGRKP